MSACNRCVHREWPSHKALPLPSSHHKVRWQVRCPSPHDSALVAKLFYPSCWDEGTMFQSHLLPVVFCEGATMKTYLDCSSYLSRSGRGHPQVVR